MEPKFKLGDMARYHTVKWVCIEAYEDDGTLWVSDKDGEKYNVTEEELEK